MQEKMHVEQIKKRDEQINALYFFVKDGQEKKQCLDVNIRDFYPKTDVN
jgi:hypothetical protein